MLKDVDLIVFDLQDVGCRVYTFLTTLHYLLEAAGQNDIPIWVLDRPNPAGRQIDGLALEYGEESFVGTAQIPMAHGLTLGEMAGWLNDTFKIGASLTVKKMEGYELDPGISLLGHSLSLGLTLARMHRASTWHDSSRHCAP